MRPSTIQGNEPVHVEALGLLATIDQAHDRGGDMAAGNRQTDREKPHG